MTLNRKKERNIGFPVPKGPIERAKVISGGTYQCAIYALQNDISMNIAGGTHHAFKDKVESFCVFNDMAIASMLLLHHKLANKILFVDLDVHQGNGNANIFKNDPRVFTFSLHAENNYQQRKEKSDLDIGVADKIEDEVYLKILYNTLPVHIESEKPDLIFCQSGVDILETGKLGRLSVSIKACKKSDHFLLEQCFKNNIPIVVTMEGGYSVKISDIIEAHANTYRAVQYIFF